MPTHLTDSQLVRFKTNPLEPFDKVNIGIKSILASRVIQPKNLANALDHHNICSRVFLFAHIRKSMDLGLAAIEMVVQTLAFSFGHHFYLCS